MMAENVSKTFWIGSLWRSATAANGKFSWQVSTISTILDRGKRVREKYWERLWTTVQVW